MNVLVNLTPTIRYTKWWWKFVPKKRQELKIMQALLDYYFSKEDFQHKYNEYVKDTLLYGGEPRHERLS